jgi:hypothetical protein
VTLDLVPIDEVEGAALLEVIERAFGRGRGLDWFLWKHREGPWGPSTGYAALDEQGVVGVRLLLPWRLRLGPETITALRAVEAATLPRARGRGVFSQLNAALMDQHRASSDPAILFSTPNELSRDGYSKLGWSRLGPLPHAYRLTPMTTRGSSASISLDGPDGLAPLPARDPTPLIGTAWTAESMRWRIDPRSGHEYRVAHLEHASAPTGLVYRIMTRHRLRILTAIAVWGTSGDRRALVAGTARRERAPVVLDTVEPGGQQQVPGRGFNRGSSLVMTWHNDRWPGARPWAIDDIQGWTLTFADLESVL